VEGESLSSGDASTRSLRDFEEEDKDAHHGNKGVVSCRRVEYNTEHGQEKLVQGHAGCADEEEVPLAYSLD
jgi:hypothetical protein